MNACRNYNVFTLFALVFFAFVLLLSTPTVHGWERYADFSEIRLPLNSPGSTSMTFSVPEGISLRHRYTSTDLTEGIYTFSAEKPFVQEAYVYDNEPVTVNQVKDVYIHTEAIPFTGEVALVSGSICVQENQLVPVCLSQPGEVHTITTDQPTKVIVTGEEDAIYLPSFTVGDGREQYTLVDKLESSFEHYRTSDNTLYRILWFASTYEQSYIEHIFAEKWRLKWSITAYESGGCPCETFDPENSEHYLQENIAGLCPIPSFAEGYWPRSVEEGRSISSELLQPCPPRPTAEYIAAWERFSDPRIDVYAKIAWRYVKVQTRFFFQERNLGKVIERFQSGEADENELLTSLSTLKEIADEALYLTSNI